jgi:hypothetical protein
VCVCVYSEGREGRQCRTPGTASGGSSTSSLFGSLASTGLQFFLSSQDFFSFLGSIADPDSHPDPYNFAGLINMNSKKQVRFL